MAEAAFSDKVWRPRLERLQGLARIRIVHCAVAAEVAFGRAQQRRTGNRLRLAHADPGPEEAVEWIRWHEAFDRVRMDVPWIEVDTTDGYVPGLAEIMAFVNEQRSGQAAQRPGRPDQVRLTNETSGHRNEKSWL